MSAHKKLRSGEYKSPTFIKVGMHICKNATEYTFAAGQSLLLFAKINTEAARRIGKNPLGRMPGLSIAPDVKVSAAGQVTLKVGRGAVPSVMKPLLM